MSENTELKIAGLEKLLKSLKGKPAMARIGILGKSAARTGGAMNNAQIGAMHEFGTSSLPQRSFLRIPISENLGSALEGSGAFDKDTLKDVLKLGSLTPWVKKMAIVAEGVVAEAFETGGFGKWPPSNMAHKKNQQTLVETQQLRNSITSEVIE